MVRSGDFAGIRPTRFLIFNQSSTNYKDCKDVESWSVLWFMQNMGHGSDFNISRDPDKGVKCIGQIIVCVCVCMDTFFLV